MYTELVTLAVWNTLVNPSLILTYLLECSVKIHQYSCTYYLLYVDYLTKTSENLYYISNSRASLEFLTPVVSLPRINT